MHKMPVLLCRTQFSVESIEQELNFIIDRHKMYVFIYRTPFSAESIAQELNFRTRWCPYGIVLSVCLSVCAHCFAAVWYIYKCLIGVRTSYVIRMFVLRT